MHDVCHVRSFYASGVRLGWGSVVVQGLGIYTATKSGRAVSMSCQREDHGILFAGHGYAGIHEFSRAWRLIL